MVRGLDHTLKGIEVHVITFVNYTLIASESNEQDLQNLEELLERLSNYRITLNLEKSHFFKEETKFLAYSLTIQRIRSDTEREFLGLINLYLKFSNRHAEKTLPLLTIIK